MSPTTDKDALVLSGKRFRKSIYIQLAILL